MRLLTAVLAFAALAIPAHAATVGVEQGNIIVDGQPVTSGGNDSDPLLSPDGKFVVFVRLGADSDAMAKCSSDGALPVRGVALYRVGIDGKGLAKLLDAHGSDKPETSLCEFDSMAFDSSGRYLYFDTPAWATSSAVHVLDLKAKRERFFVAGGLERVLAGCGDKKYRDHVIVTQHRYFVFGGSYDWAYLFSPAGKELGAVTDDARNLAVVDEACAAAAAQ
ncbi:MAG: hypothetical protein ACTHOR_04565 [Devosia sp.]|nr:hypothetical protein [Devosiaceae bacterium]